MKIEQIAEKIQQESGRLYLVGGALRDSILGITCQDHDYCVTGLTAAEFQKMFPESRLQGKDFAVFVIENVEFAMARKEKKTGMGHKEFDIETGKHITIEEDLARRDITINSMAQDVLTKEIIDPYGGRQDLEKRQIRATTDAFEEDPLRVYRVARFAAKFDFQVEPDTLARMQTLKEELATLSKERVFVELRKALKEKKPSTFFQVLKKADVLEVHFKEIADLIGKEQPIQYHPEGDSFNHTMQVLDQISMLTEEEKIRFCGLVHDLGKGTTPKEILPHHYGHEERGEKLVGQLGKRLGLPNEWISCGKTAAKEHMKGGYFEKMKPSTQVSFIERVGKSRLGLEGLGIVVRADKARNLPIEQTKQPRFVTLGLECLTEVTGKNIKKDSHHRQGKEFGEKLHEERIKWLKEKEKLRQNIE